MCKFLEGDGVLSLTEGRVPYADESPDNGGRFIDPKPKNLFPKSSGGYLEFSDSISGLSGENLERDYAELDVGFTTQFTWTTNRTFENYESLKSVVEEEYEGELENMQGETPSRVNIDPYVFDLHYATRLVEEFGERLEQLVYFREKVSTDKFHVEMGEPPIFNVETGEMESMVSERCGWGGGGGGGGV